MARDWLRRLALGLGLGAVVVPAPYAAAMLVMKCDWRVLAVLIGLLFMVAVVASLAVAAYVGYRLSGPGVIGYLAGGWLGFVVADAVVMALLPALYPGLVYNGEDYIAIGLLGAMAMSLSALISVVLWPVKWLRARDRRQVSP